MHAWISIAAYRMPGWTQLLLAGWADKQTNGETAEYKFDATAALRYCQLMRWGLTIECHPMSVEQKKRSSKWNHPTLARWHQLYCGLNLNLSGGQINFAKSILFLVDSHYQFPSSSSAAEATLPSPQPLANGVSTTCFWQGKSNEETKRKQLVWFYIEDAFRKFKAGQ